MVEIRNIIDGAEIDVKYKGLELVVSGGYDTDEWKFSRSIQIMHNGADLDSIIDEDVKEEILNKADAAYKEYLLERNR